jgi:hypothetical protein
MSKSSLRKVLLTGCSILMLNFLYDDSRIFFVKLKKSKSFYPFVGYGLCIISSLYLLSFINSLHVHHPATQ